MSLVGKIFLGLTLVCVLAAAGLSYMVFNRVEEQKTTISTKETELKSAQEEASKQANLAKTRESEAAAKAEEAAKAQADAKRAKDEYESAQKKVTDLSSQLSAKDQEIQAKQEELQKVQDQYGMTPEQLTEMKGQFEKDFQILSEEKTIIADGLEKARMELEALKDREERRKKGILPMGLRGKIVAVNTQWNFVVLNIGDADQVVEGAQMLVYRGNTMLGRVKIRTVDPRSSIADIISLTEAGRGGKEAKVKLDIRPGDMVIF